MKIHLLSGFLGSGKTTAIQQASLSLMQEGIKTGVIANDQGIKLVDNHFFESLQIPSRQVINGCFCCNYNDLAAGILSLIETNQTEIIFAESVGSCTDIVATVLKPLLLSYAGAQVTVSVFADARLLEMMLSNKKHAFAETVRYIYLKQLEEAGIIVVNKIDLIGNRVLSGIKEYMQQHYPGKVLLYQNSLDAGSIQEWLKTIDSAGIAGNLSSLTIDYDVYAAGEASLAWLDQELEIYSPVNNARQHAVDLVNNIYSRINVGQYAIGHFKCFIDGAVKISFVSNSEPPASIKKQFSGSASLLINIRVQASPEEIQQLLTEAIHNEEAKSGCRIIVNSLSAFQPGYPKPTHRM